MLYIDIYFNELNPLNNGKVKLLQLYFLGPFGREWRGESPRRKKTPIEGAHQKKIPPTIPTIVIENMTSIFAQSGKMTIQQACEPDE